MKYYCVCPFCGQDLLKAENGSCIEISCPKCNEEIMIEIENDKLVICRALTTEIPKTED